jgi:outer membrane protein assembly factor BamD
LITHVATLAILVLLGWTEPGDQILWIADNTAAEQATVSEADQLASKDMDIGRELIARRNYTGALNRFKVVVTRYQASRHVEEALAHLVEAYLVLGIACQAQNLASVLGQEFPDGRWTATAREALKAAGLEPAENETRCY